MANYPALDSCISEFSERLDRVRQDVYYCDALALHPMRRELSYGIEAGTYIWVAAAVEAATRGLLAGILAHINNSQVSVGDLRLSLLALSNAPMHDSLQSVRGLKMWRSRAELHNYAGSSAVCTFDPARLPLDGRTVRPQHLETAWEVFGFGGTPTPSPLHRLALTDVADARNGLAHGEVDAQEVAGRKSRTDLLRVVGHIEGVIINVWVECAAYLDGRLYLR